jgi:hypothetical protein
MSTFAQYWKAAVAAVSPVFLLVQAAVTDNHISGQEWVGIAAAAVVAGGVLVKGNAKPPLGPGAQGTGNFIRP